MLGAGGLKGVGRRIRLLGGAAWLVDQGWSSGTSFVSAASAPVGSKFLMGMESVL